MSPPIIGRALGSGMGMGMLDRIGSSVGIGMLAIGMSERLGRSVGMGRIGTWSPSDVESVIEMPTPGSEAGITPVPSEASSLPISMGREIGREMGRDVGREMGSEVGREMGNEVGTEMGNDVGTDIGSEVGRGMGSDVGIEIGREVGTVSPRGRVMGGRPGREITVGRGREIGGRPGIEMVGSGGSIGAETGVQPNATKFRPLPDPSATTCG
ncbi:hypothetical protein C8Q80DRAFT_190066 [Daedaleopsis nitida]|nr:hypothetical protein C8Q80DRAFT_190066 [Daedaleopsis nitida]